MEAGLGVSVVLESAIVDEVRAGSLHAVPLADAALGKDLLVIQRDDQLASAPAAHFAAHLLQEHASDIQLEQRSRRASLRSTALAHQTTLGGLSAQCQQAEANGRSRLER